MTLYKPTQKKIIAMLYYIRNKLEAANMLNIAIEEQDYYSDSVVQCIDGIIKLVQENEQ